MIFVVRMFKIKEVEKFTKKKDMENVHEKKTWKMFIKKDLENVKEKRHENC